jgi:integrase
MTQKDISDLVHSEVDWEKGRINRKRSKTKTSDNVPTVSYLLWPETKELLLKHRSQQASGPVLLNTRGEPLLTVRISNDGKYSKMDNIRNAYDRLRRKTKIDKPFKCLKKTSASLLRDHEESSSIVGLFLGHAPRDVSERYYAAAPQQLLDRAILWLRDHYAKYECFAAKPTPLKH